LESSQNSATGTVHNFCFVIVLAEHSGCVAVMGLFWVAFLLQSLNRLQVAYTEGQERTTKDK